MLVIFDKHHVYFSEEFPRLRCRFLRYSIKMFIKSPALASDGSELLLYRLRFVTPGTFLSIMRFGEFRFVWFTVRLFPARSKL